MENGTNETLYQAESLSISDHTECYWKVKSQCIRMDKNM